LTDEFYMQRALRLARRGEQRVSPNPMVGAVIVKGGRIIGEGYHEHFGGPHAEINALLQVQEPVQGAIIYVTLEPCSHYGKTPPCVEALIGLQLARVVIGTADPNPLVAGSGINALWRAGIDVTVGVLEVACREINERFFKFITTGIPYVTLKFAQTIDGRIASVTGHSRWISSPAARTFAHRLRSTHDAILVGAGTVLADDPELTVRHVKGKNPVRIVVDSHLRLPLKAKILQNQEKAPTIIATTKHAAPKKIQRLKQLGIETLMVDELIGADGSRHVDLQKLLLELGKRQIASVLVEGGATIITSLLQKKLADRLVIIVAPKILGRGIEAVADLGNQTMDEAIKLDFRKVYRRGGDIIIDALPAP
jgi:diaminohydroxyphosphoribosylaminopyrimidine deaminase/5-amino-6-(5-phosphoribosylamino)uracil reductase